jgi:hypothetical protein
MKVVEPELKKRRVVAGADDVDDDTDENQEPSAGHDDDGSTERPTIPDELVLRLASYVNGRKLYLTLLTLTKSIQKKSQLIEEHPKFDWPQLAVSSADSAHASHVFTSDSKYLLQARTEQNGLKLKIWDRLYGPEEHMFVGDFWKTASNKEVRELSRMDEQPSAYKGFFSKDGRHLAVVYEDDNSRSSLGFDFVRIYDLSPSDRTGRPSFDAKRYFDLGLGIPTSDAGRFKSLEFSSNGNHGCINFENKGFVFKMNGDHFRLDDVAAVCCTNDFAIWQCSSNAIYLLNLEVPGVPYRWANLTNGQKVSSFCPCPTDSSLIAYVTKPEKSEEGEDEEEGDVEYFEEVKLGIFQFGKSEGSEFYDIAAKCGHVETGSKLPESFLLEEDEFDLEGRRPKLVWTLDGSQILFNHFDMIHPIAFEADPDSLNEVDPSSQLGLLATSINKFLHDKFDFDSRFIIKGFELSPDLKALIVQIGDKSEDAGPDTFLLWPA